MVPDPVVTPEISESRDASEPAEVSENFERYDEVDERLAACLLPNFKTELRLSHLNEPFDSRLTYIEKYNGKTDTKNGWKSGHFILFIWHEPFVTNTIKYLIIISFHCNPSETFIYS